MVHSWHKMVRRTTGNKKTHLLLLVPGRYEINSFWLLLVRHLLLLAWHLLLLAKETNRYNSHKSAVRVAVAKACRA